MRKLLPLILALLLLSAVVSHAQNQQAKSTQTFASFWAQFKAALAKNDKEAIASNTKLPFLFSNKELSRGDFIKKLNLIFEIRRDALLRRNQSRIGRVISCFAVKRFMYLIK